MFQTQRVRPFPFRTRKLSFAVAKILAWRRAGKIVHRQHSLKWDIWLLRMSHFSVFRAKALQSPAHPAPPLTGSRRHTKHASLCSSTEPRWYAKPVFQRSTEPGNLFAQFHSLASLCSSTELRRHTEPASLCSSTELGWYAKPASLCSSTELGWYAKHASLCSSTELGWYAEPASLCSSTELRSHIHYVHMPP